MKRKVILIVIFATVILLVLSGIQWVIDYGFNKKTKHKFNLLLQHKTDSAIMVFGSSVAHVQIDPQIITRVSGLSCFNEGWDGIFFVQYEGLIKEYMSYQKNCRCIIIASDFDNLGKNELITRPDLFISHLSNNYVYESLHNIEPTKIFLSRYFPGYRLTVYNKGFYKNFITTESQNKNYNGFEPRNIPWQGTTVHPTPFNARYDETI